MQLVSPVSKIGRSMRWPLEDKKEAIESTSERLRFDESACWNFGSFTRSEDAIGP